MKNIFYVCKYDSAIIKQIKIEYEGKNIFKIAKKIK